LFFENADVSKKLILLFEQKRLIKTYDQNVVLVIA